MAVAIMAVTSLDLYHGYLEQFLYYPYFSFPPSETLQLTDCLHYVVAVSLDQGRQIVKIQCEKPEGEGKEGWDEASRDEELVADPRWGLDLI